jgi:GTPase SAR1 family protein
MATNEQTPVPISITICGDGGCGKSSITLRLVHSQWTNEYDPTIEDSYSITRRIDGTTYHLAITDTAGQEEYRGMWATANLGADAFLLVYDITSRDSLDALEYFDELIGIETETRLDNAERAKKAGLRPGATVASGSGKESKTVPPIKIVAGNKCDLQESREVSAAAGLEWARQHGCGFMETSARNEVNIEETFELLVRRVVEARRLAEGGNSAKVGNARGMTKPLAPLTPGGGDDEKAGGDPTPGSEKVGRGQGGFWKKLRCW